MISRALGLGVALVALSIASCASPRAEEPAPGATAVFERYLVTRGGQGALDAMEVIEREGWISVDTGPNGLLAGTYHTCLRYPDRVAIEINAGPWQQAQALRADGAFECVAGFQSCRQASEDVRTELVATADHANKDLLDRAAEWRAAAVSESVDGRAWRLTLQDGRWAEFARDDGHLRGLGAGDRWRRLGQWRTVAGMTFPHRIEDFAVQSDGESEWRNSVQLGEIRVSDTPSAWCAERIGAD